MKAIIQLFQISGADMSLYIQFLIGLIGLLYRLIVDKVQLLCLQDNNYTKSNSYVPNIHIYKLTLTTDTNIRQVNSVIAHCGIFKIGLLSTQYANDNKNIKTRSWRAAGDDYSHGIYTMPNLWITLLRTYYYIVSSMYT